MTASSAAVDFARYVRPQLMERLRAIGLDVEYHRAAGDSLFLMDGDGREVEVLDLVGGFGAGLLGHNHPELVARARELLEAGRPFHAQASARAFAGTLGRRLSERVGATTGREYRVTFAASGTEAVEAAIKHAELERVRRGEAILEDLSDAAHEVRLRLRDGRAFLPDRLFDDAVRLLGVTTARTLDDIVTALMRVARDALERPTLFLSLDGAFHGKTTGSLRLTAGAEYRTPWRNLGPRTVLLPRHDEDGAGARALRDVITAEQRIWYALEIGADGAVAIAPRTACAIAGCFIEPIQGEGGIRELDPAYAALLRATADEHGFPLIIDEIQSGMGRTGRFLASESLVRGDYYLLSKSLGGGLAKISALLVDGTRYIDDFGWLHTSTTADDDFSSAIALRTLDIIERDDGAVMRRVRETGDWFLARLRELRDRYPAQLAAVRGRGLMIGIEIMPPAGSHSPLLRVLDEQNLLGFLICGYLLHEERIRVAPTISAHGTIRLQPSAFVPRAELDRFCSALERVLIALRDGDVHRLSRFLARGTDAGPDGDAEHAARTESAAPPRNMVAAIGRRPDVPLVGFLSNFLTPDDLRDWEPGLAALSTDACEQFLDRTRGMLRPFEVTSIDLHSAVGGGVRAMIIAAPFTPAQAADGLRGGDVAWMQSLVREGVDMARRAGCTLVGFGGYTSIVTNACRDIAASDIALTSGNSLTSAAALDALFQAGDRIGVEARRLGVVGGLGNIGQVLAEAAAPDVDEIVLIGREGARQRLVAVARALTDRTGRHVRVATRLEALRDCTLIISATSAPRPVILPEHVAHRPIVIVDVAVPGDVDPAVIDARPDAVVLRGGVVRAPLGQHVSIPGMRLDNGEIYGCLAETSLLGMAGIREHFSYGPLTAANVRRIRDLARIHGFTVTESPAPATSSLRNA